MSWALLPARIETPSSEPCGATALVVAQSVATSPPPVLKAPSTYATVVVFASTELDELLELGDVIITMRDGRIVGRYEGDVDEALLMRDMTHGDTTHNDVTHTDTTHGAEP